jgi:magnesium transporter
MLAFRSCTAPIETPGDLSKDALPPDTSWIDAHNPDEKEIAFLERTLAIHVPTYERLVEIESSSRLSVEDDHIIASLPLVLREADGMPRTTPVGFVLSREMLLTVHFQPLRAFDHLSLPRVGSNGAAQAGISYFLTIVECIIDHVADVLEHVGADLDDISSCIFSEDLARKHEPRKEGANLRSVLRRVGRSGDLTAKISDSLLGMGRMIPYVVANAAAYITPTEKRRLDNLARDISSLNDYETHLTDKIQLLVDVTLGFTNVDQNNVFRVLTVFSIIGIPPTFFASMWGMNFKTIPEYDWAWGYPFGLSVIIMSAVIPAVWFKWRGWW